MILVGLTGGIGSGKSTVSELLARRGAVMRTSEPLPQDLPLIEAVLRLRSKGTRAEAVVDPTGRVTGVLTQENIAEMMMVENARPGWRFRRR